MDSLVVVEEGTTSSGAHFPDLPGCVTTAETREEVLALIRAAIEFHIEGSIEDGLSAPVPASSMELVRVAA